VTTETTDEPSARCNQQAYGRATRLTKSGNDVEVTTNLCIYKSQILFESDTFIWKRILLDIAKYIH